MLADAVRTEYVRIPLGGTRPGTDQPVVAFGAAAGYVHAATGFSVASSMRAAPRVAAAIGRGAGSRLRPAPFDPAPIAEAVWPAAMRRTRVLHDYGLEVLLDSTTTRSGRSSTHSSSCRPSEWRGYLRIDAPPAEVSRA